MMTYRTLPLLRLLLAFIAGIVLYDAIGWLPSWMPAVIISFLTVLAILLGVNFPVRFRRQQWVAGALTLVVVFLTGMLVTHNYFGNHVAKPISPVEPARGWIARITSLPSPRTNSQRLEAKVLAVEVNGKLTRFETGALLYFPATAEKLPALGQTIAVSAVLREIPNALNPGAFDYKKYLARQGIHRQAWVREGTFRVLDIPVHRSVFFYSELIRQKLVTILRQNLPDSDVQSVAAAILLGYDDLLDSELRAAYSGTGAMHVLCVSGLHVGIFYAIFAALLFPLSRSKRGEIIKTVLLLLLIWGYAVLTGLSPSVSRSATMFTFVAIGKGFHRRTSVLNSLMASAFFLLSVNPYYLFSAGFQLSFAAVAGIVTFQPVLASWWPVRNKAFVYLRDLVTVSIAAQMFTMPITLFGFHQFPNYFLLANMVVIPLSFFVLVSGMATLAFFWIPSVGQALAWVLGQLIWLMNYLISVIEELPGASTQVAVFGLAEAVLLFVVVVGLLFWLVMKQRQGLFVSLISLLLLVGSVQFQRFRHSRQHSFVVADGGKHLLLGSVQGRKANWLGSAAEAPGFSLSALNQHFAIDHRQSAYQCLGMPDSLSAHFLVLSGYRVVVIDSSFKLPENDKTLRVDWVIIGSRPRIKPDRVVHRILGATWVLASNLSEYQQKRWKEELQKQKAKCYSIKETGALIYPPPQPLTSL